MATPFASSVRYLAALLLVCGLLACGEGASDAPVTQAPPDRAQTPPTPPAPAPEPAEQETAPDPASETDPATEPGLAPALSPALYPDPSAVQPTARLSDTPGAPRNLESEEQFEHSAPTAPTNLTPDPSLEPQPVEADTLDASRLVGITPPAGGPISFENGESPVPAPRIAFVIDASGPMQELLPKVWAELLDQIDRMNEHNHFTIITFSGEGIYELPGTARRVGLRSADDDFKQAAKQWLDPERDAFPTGGNASVHAGEAIEHALKYEPQLVYLVSITLGDADQDPTAYEAYREQLLTDIAQANAKLERPAKFYTVQLVDIDPAQRGGLTGTMRLIAEQSNGSYRFIDQRRLDRR